MGDNEETKRLIFLHHSCGANWLEDNGGGLGIALKEKNYYVSDTYYGWGPDNIGDDTDVGYWWNWFCGPNSKTYMNAVYKENKNVAEYTRLANDIDGENTVVMFKSCFPNSILRQGNGVIPTIADNPLKGIGFDTPYHTIENAKGIYIEILKYFEKMQDKLFIAITAPPVQDEIYAKNARDFNNWLANEWLKDYSHNNVGVFDFYNVLTGDKGDILAYPSSDEDDHPTNEGNIKATQKFIPFIEELYGNFSK